LKIPIIKYQYHPEVKTGKIRAKGAKIDRNQTWQVQKIIILN